MPPDIHATLKSYRREDQPPLQEVAVQHSSNPSQPCSHAQLPPRRRKGEVRQQQKSHILSSFVFVSGLTKFAYSDPPFYRAMALYKNAAAILSSPLSSEGSLKSRVYNSNGTIVYALITECAKWDVVLSEVIENAGILSQEPKVRYQAV